ncbi:EVE domain-containing protein [Polyangium sp. 15x6]|uniref:EVE domain-containing protein n=1 Tax=Polyangium sp. 15x6 TaxID=3042687 RepID=UPI00249A820A|nr:EVE domain-containing protein [Polyangium sp. 15x6]MDI3282261.1 EVE domain-containing protein [Polyangium sp. 15x6]
MTHLITLFSPETYRRFSESKRDTSAVRIRQQKAAERVSVGDFLVAYMTGLSRWVGLFEVTGRAYRDQTPIFAEKDDPFVVRLPIKTHVWLAPQHGLPIHDRALWQKLSFTRGHEPNSTLWTGSVRTSLAPLDAADAKLLDALLRAQAGKLINYPLDASEARLIEEHRVRREGGEVTVSVPEDAVDLSSNSPKLARESVRVQALLAKIGATMGFRVWIPTSDRASVLREQPAVEPSLLQQLPLNYDNTTLKTIENIDVIWLKGRSMARAFEVEHTTAIYSGILRMADLLALQPNMDIRLHIVGPEDRRRKVFDEIRRPVFSLIEGKPLQERCTFLSYDSVDELAKLPHLGHVNDSILSEYEDDARSEGA